LQPKITLIALPAANTETKPQPLPVTRSKGRAPTTKQENKTPGQRARDQMHKYTHIATWGRELDIRPGHQPGHHYTHPSSLEASEKSNTTWNGWDKVRIHRCQQFIG